MVRNAGMAASPARLTAAPIRIGMRVVSVGVVVAMSNTAWKTATTSRL
jgi:hypothetical protein